jgi:hypothetical protein
MADRSLTNAQRRELRLLAHTPQLSFGRHRARVQNNLVRLGLAQLVEVDGLTTCRITALGHRAHEAGKVPPTESTEALTPLERITELRQRLNSLRTQRVATESELTAIERRIQETEVELIAARRARDGEP